MRAERLALDMGLRAPELISAIQTSGYNIFKARDNDDALRRNTSVGKIFWILKHR